MGPDQISKLMSLLKSLDSSGAILEIWSESRVGERGRGAEGPSLGVVYPCNCLRHGAHC